MLNGLSLFSGIGGLDVALSNWVRPIAYCEIDPYCQGVLLSRMANGDITNAPIWDNVTTFDGTNCNSIVDIIYGGFPCQGISVAGLGKGLADERSGLFFEIMRLAKEIKPKFLFLENVPAITSRGGWECVHAISALGYDCRWCVISAAEVGALHKRERFFLLAHSKSERLERENRKEQTQPMLARSGFWEAESPVDRVADGVSNRMDKLKALGNAVVPSQAREAFRILSGLA